MAIKPEKLSALLENEDFLCKLSRAGSKHDMQMLFSDNGLEISIEEVDTFINMMNVACSDELSEEKLECIAAGYVASNLLISAVARMRAKDARRVWIAGVWFINQLNH